MGLLLQKLKDGIVFYDGSKATFLQKLGLDSGDSAEYWNVTRPQDVARMTRAFIEAGSNMVQTNTFSANRPTLDSMGLGEEIAAINREGAKIAQDCAGGRDVLVAASIGPSGLYFEPAGYLSFDMAVEIFRQQLEPLLEEGIRIFNFETFMDINEMRAGIVALHELDSDAEIISTMTFHGDHTMNGSPANACAVTCSALGATVVGANCSGGPRTLLRPLAMMETVIHRQLCVKPNAGLPQSEHGKTIFGIGPTEFAKRMEPFARSGVRLLGGCCGTTPAYIKALHDRLAGMNFPPPPVVDRPYIASPVGILDMSRDDLYFCEMEFDEITEEMEEEEFMSVCDILPEDVDDCDACIVDFRHLEDDFSVAKLITALTLFVKKPLILRGGSRELCELFLRYYPGRAAVVERESYPARMYGALIVNSKLKPLEEQNVG